MNARTIISLVALGFLAGHAEAGKVDKAKLRKLANLPEVSVAVGIGFSSVYGFSFDNDTPDPLAEIARLRKQLQGDARDVERYQRLGQLYSKSKRKKESEESYAEAIALCRQQVRAYPDDRHWLVQLGYALTYTGEIEEGEKLLRRAVKEAPMEWLAWLGLAECVDSRAVQALVGGKSLSIHFVKERLDIPTLDEQKPTTEQIALMRRLRKEAKRYYQRAIELAPRETRPLVRRSIANGCFNLIEAKLRQRKGEKLDMLATCLSSEYVADMCRIARLSPDDPKAIGSAVCMEIIACIAHEKIGIKGGLNYTNLSGAMDRSIVELLPEEQRKFVRWSMERLEQLTKKPDKATAAAASEILAEMLWMIREMDEERGPRFPRLGSMGGTGFGMGGEFVPVYHPEDEATRAIHYHLNRAVALDPSRDRAWDMLIGLLLEKKQIEVAAAVARKRIAVKDNAHNHFLLAKVYAQRDSFAEAGKALRAGLKSDSKDANCRLGLIAVLLKREDAESLQAAGKELEVLQAMIEQSKSKARKRNYLLLRGIHAALSDRSGEANTLFRDILRQSKGDTAAARALTALGEPLTPADRQLALDSLEKLGADVSVRDGGEQADSPVKRISFGSKNSPEDLFFLSALPRLRELSLSGLAFTDAGLPYLESLTDLQCLEISFTKISDKGLIHLKALTELRELRISDSEITDAGLVHLEHLRNLECLELISHFSRHEKPKITHVGLAHLRDSPKLRDVSLSGITNEGLARLAAIPQLRRLDFYACKITDDGMKHFERLTELSELRLYGAKITDAGIAHLKELRQLRNLDLSRTKITDAGLAYLQGLSCLEELDLSKTAITDVGLAHLCGLTNLKKLNLNSEPGIDLAIFGKPKTKPTKGRITGVGLKHLQGLTKLTNLDLSGHSITDVGLSDIEKLTRIEYLSLRKTNVTDAGLAHLHGLKKLEILSVRETNVTDKGIAELRKIFPKLQVHR